MIQNFTRELTRYMDKRETVQAVTGTAGVSSIKASSAAQLTGDVTLSAGTKTTLTQTGQTIQIAVTAAKGGLSFYIDGTLAVETQAITIIIPAGLTLTIASVSVAVDTAPAGASLIIDVNKNGTTLFTTQANRPTITAGNTSATSAAPDVTSLSGGDRVSIDIDQIGSTTAGENLAVTVNCTEA